MQSRDITARMNDDPLAAATSTEWDGVLERARNRRAGEIAFAKSELSELLPKPTPLSLSLMMSFWQCGGSLDLAYRRLGLEYQIDHEVPSPLITIFGRLYMDKCIENARTPSMSALTARRIAKDAERIESEFRGNFLPDFLSRMTLLEAVDFDRLSTADLHCELMRIHADYINATHLEVDTINIVAGLLLEAARRAAIAEGLDPAQCLAHVPPTAAGLAQAVAAKAPRSERLQRLTKGMGHRAAFDYELADPRYSEVPDTLLKIHGHSPDGTGHLNPTAQQVPPEKASAALRLAIARACRFQALKEDAKHHSLRQLAVLRHAVLTMARRLGLGDQVFFLTFEELALSLSSPVERLSAKAQQRKRVHAALLSHPPLAPNLTWADLEQAASPRPASHANGAGQTRGTRVSGTAVVAARACCVCEQDAESGVPIPDFKDGDIIVSSMIHPGWLPQIRKASGMVCEVGGWLSHMAIVARELQIPMLVRTTGLGSIPHGARIEIGGDGLIAICEDRNDRSSQLLQAAE